MFVSDTIHNAQYIHDLFFPHDDGPNLIKQHFYLIWPLIPIFILILLHPVPLLSLAPTCIISRLRQQNVKAAVMTTFLFIPVMSRELTEFYFVQLNIKTLLRQQQEEDFHQYLEALDPMLQQYSRFSEGEKKKTSARMSGFAFRPLQQPAIHALPTDLWTAVTQSQEAW